MQHSPFAREREHLVRVREKLSVAILAAFFLGDHVASPRDQAAHAALVQALAAIEAEIVALDTRLSQPGDSHAA